jgi:ABC-2 type transport system permease protein
MIATLLRIGWLNLKRDRVAQALTFLLPIIFFSIFATVFGNQRGSTRRVPVAIVDEDRSEFSQQLVKALMAEGGLKTQTTASGTDAGELLDRASATKLVSAGTISVAVVLPKGLGESRRAFGTEPAAVAPKVQLLADVSDPVAPQVVMGLLQKVSFTAAPESLATTGLAMFERYGGPLTPAQQRARDEWLSQLRQQTASGAASPMGPSAGLGLATETVNVLQPGGGDTATISFYAAGVGVMFLLFSCAGAGGALLDEEEAGTLGRLIGSQAGMRGVLVGKWLFVTLLGMTQLSVMFLWGQLVFHLPLMSHLPGFVVMALFTAAAASGFGLMLATMSRTRAQLSGLSTILILTMSALGGSMFPRFLMSETMQKVGLVTFNAWALDGFLKVFWRGARIVELWPQVAVLTGLTVIFATVARLFARRWETL